MTAVDLLRAVLGRSTRFAACTGRASGFTTCACDCTLLRTRAARRARLARAAGFVRRAALATRAACVCRAGLARSARGATVAGCHRVVVGATERDRARKTKH